MALPSTPLPTWQYLPAPRSALLSHWDCRLAGFREDLGQPVQRLEVASARVRLVIGFEARYRLVPAGAPGASDAARSCQAFLIGMAGSAMTTEHPAMQSCIEVDLPPWAAFSLLQGDGAAVGAGLLDLSELWGAPIRSLADELNSLPCWKARFARVERFLAGRLQAPRRQVDARLQQAWAQMALQHGQVPMTALREHTGWSARHFAQRFSAHFGLAPKAAAMRQRFARAHALLLATPTAGLADLADRCGYSDQSHFTREFRHFAACSPAAYARADLGGVPGKPASLVGH